MTTGKGLAIAWFLSSMLVCRAQEFQITFQVADDSQKPVPGATVKIFAVENWQAGGELGEKNYKKTTAVTNAAGVASFHGISPEQDLTYGIQAKSGFYGFGRNDYWFEKANGTRWQPWNPTVKLALRAIGHPAPMYAKMPQNLVIPLIGKAIGYDLEIGDWVAPYGQGISSDFIFRLDRKPDNVEKAGYDQRALWQNNRGHRPGRCEFQDGNYRLHLLSESRAQLTKHGVRPQEKSFQEFGEI